MHAMYQLDGFHPDEIDEALRPTMQAMEDIVTTKPQQKTGSMRRTKRARGNIVPFPARKTRKQETD